MRRTGRAWRVVAMVVALAAAAPTAGDIGSCGQDVVVLDQAKFFSAKEATDCAQCNACALDTKQCVRACDKKLDQVPFPPNCFPLVHDGEVCLRKLHASSCSDYASFMADEGSTIPTECNFCPPELAGNGGSP
ncbi:MAG: hypothetical protein U0414_28300 [Polyangiaceae bacterium]